MSDDRFQREPGDDSDEVEGRPYVDPKPRSWYGPAPVKRPAFDIAAECDKFLDEFCAKFGIKRRAKAKDKPVGQTIAPLPTDEDWSKLR